MAKMKGIIKLVVNLPLAKEKSTANEKIIILTGGNNPQFLVNLPNSDQRVIK